MSNEEPGEVEKVGLPLPVYVADWWRPSGKAEVETLSYGDTGITGTGAACFFNILNQYNM